MNNPLNPMLDTLSRPMDVAGRILLALYFLGPALMKIAGFAGTLAYRTPRVPVHVFGGFR